MSSQESETGSDSDSDRESAGTWSTDAIEQAADKLRTELEDEKRGASGKKSEALEKARDLVDRAEEKLKKKT